MGRASAPIGSPVRAAGPGSVLRARFDKVNGEHITIDHGNGVRTSYCHGETPHVEVRLRVGGRAVDPMPFRQLPQG